MNGESFETVFAVPWRKGLPLSNQEARIPTPDGAIQVKQTRAR